MGTGWRLFPVDSGCTFDQMKAWLVFHPDWNFDWVDLMQKTAMLEFLSIMALSCPEDTVTAVFPSFCFLPVFLMFPEP